VDEFFFRCGQMSVRREAVNVLPIIAAIRDSAVQLVSVLGSVVEGEGGTCGRIQRWTRGRFVEWILLEAELEEVRAALP
jgi:hypothetical protein